MKTQWIEFISSYCDSWCERCAFTERCSVFAVQSPIAMCDGDAEAALELTFGDPATPGAAPRKRVDERIAEMANVEPTAKELDEIGREMEARQERVQKMGIAEASLDYAIAAHRWLDAIARTAAAADASLKEATDVISWDSHLIYAKIMRALNGRDEDGGAPVQAKRKCLQSDWNGSAKVALLSIERSEAACRTVAAATGADAAGVLAATLVSLGAEVKKEFPRAMEFRRPGFDK